MNDFLIMLMGSVLLIVVLFLLNFIYSITVTKHKDVIYTYLINSEETFNPILRYVSKERYLISKRKYKRNRILFIFICFFFAIILVPTFLFFK